MVAEEAADLDALEEGPGPGILFSTVMMLRHLKLPVFAERVEKAIFDTLKSGVRTRDIGGSV